MYEHTDYLLRDNLREAHETAWAMIGGPGASWRGAERVSMVAEARAALDCPLCSERKAALSPNAVAGDHRAVTDLPGIVVDMIHRIRTDSGRITKSMFDGVIGGGFTREAYVEVVGVVNTSVIIDTMHQALGLEVPDLPAVVEGEPDGHFDTTTVDEGAWVPMTKVSTKEATSSGLPQIPNIVRSMGLVPSSVALFFTAFRPHYALENIPMSISQPQAEFVASRVSALNQCFY